MVWALAALAAMRGARSFMAVGGWSEEMRVMRREQMEVEEKGGSLGIYKKSRPGGDASSWPALRDGWATTSRFDARVCRLPPLRLMCTR